MSVKILSYPKKSAFATLQSELKMTAPPKNTEKSGAVGPAPPYPEDADRGTEGRNPVQSILSEEPEEPGYGTAWTMMKKHIVCQNLPECMCRGLREEKSRKEKMKKNTVSLEIL